jgi:hypothetical protein
LKIQNPKSAGKAIFILAASAVFLTACAGPKYVSASGTEIPEKTMAEAMNRVEQENVPVGLEAYYIDLYSQGRQNSVLFAMEGGLAAMRMGEWTRAKTLFDQAIREVEALQEGADQAKRSKSKFVAEREKWFKGESYERAALYFYRGLLYLRDQDFGNAAACFKRSQTQDITGDDAPGFAGDWFSDELALALASYLQKDPGTAADALKRSKTYSSKPPQAEFKPTPDCNTLIIVEVGHGPQKIQGGHYHEQLRFDGREPPTRQLEIRAQGIATDRTGPSEDLLFQATTRGTRKVDYILGDKASFKEDTGNAALGLGGAAIVASQVDSTGISAAVLGLASIGTAIASATSTPEADIRTWDNLPYSVYLIALALPEGAQTVTVKGLGATGQTVNEKQLNIVIPPRTQKSLTVEFLRFQS